jgi:hypothetical protein
MESRRPAEVVPSPEAAAFVRFCYRRRRAGWPELYDEMCAVASRRLYNGWGFTELADHGIGFSLFETPALAALAREMVREEAERRIRAAAIPPVATDVIAPLVVSAQGTRREGPDSEGVIGEPGRVAAEDDRPEVRPLGLRLAAAGVG